MEYAAIAIQSLWNPFRDWKVDIPAITNWSTGGFKASETLLGIENQFFYWLKYQWYRRFKASETLLGIEKTGKAQYLP